MKGIFQGDVVIAETIRLGIEDLRKNPWLLNDVFASFVEEPSLRDKYGQKEVDSAIDWFLNNKIEVNLRYRNDKEQYPSVTVALNSSVEKEDMKHLGDQSTEVETLMPAQIGKPIAFIVKPFVPELYETDTGRLVIPASVSTRGLAVNQILVNPDNGSGYVIQEVLEDGVRLEPNLDLRGLNRAAVVPRFQFYRARREHTFFQEAYSVGCHTTDPSTLLWLHSIVLYLILRYRESLLEARGFAQSSVSSSDLVPSMDNPGGENVFSRYITLTGQVENSWLKTPYRVIESAEPNHETDQGLRSGIKIISNLDSPDELDTSQDIWTTIQDEED